MNTIKSKAQWIEAGRDIVFPFIVPLKNGQLVCHTPLRILPGKRITCIAEFNDQFVIAKIFFDPQKWKRHGLREERGVNHLANAGVATPKLIYHGETFVNQVYVIVFEYLKDAISFHEVWQRMNTEREQLLTQLFCMVAKLHNQGLYQDDIHLGNFLYYQKIFAIDGDAVINQLEGLSFKTSLTNLASLWVQFDCYDNDLFNKAFYLYIQERGWNLSKELIAHFKKYLNDVRYKRQARYVKKTLRDCTQFVAQNHFIRREIFPRAEFCVKQLNSGEDLLSQKDTVLLKAGNTCTVGLVRDNEERYVVKRYNIKDLKHRVSRALRPSRAAVSWKNANRLLWLGLPTPKPIALIEEKLGIFRGKAFFISAYVEGKSLDQYLQEKVSQGESWQESANHIVDLFAVLFENGIIHGDLKASNILMVDDKPMILDLDAMKQLNRNNFIFYWCWKSEMARFLKNWESVPEIKSVFEARLQEKGLII